MNLENIRFGSWTALYPIKENSTIYWYCKCDCGEEKKVRQSNLTTGRSKSCGCQSGVNRKFSNILGQKFGALTVIEKTEKRDHGAVVWKCQCECGTIVEWDVGRLKQTKFPHCGCKKSLIGEKFGKLTVIKKVEDYNTSNRNQYWECKCECGNTTILSTGDLRSGKVVGCGCTKSIGEYNIAKLLTNNNILFKKQYTFSDLKDKKLLQYDFALLDDKTNKPYRLIEFDGEQHYNQNLEWYTNTMHQHDLMKNDYAKQHNIPLVRIPYTQRDNITLQTIMGDLYLI